jgi:hypothetical protein
MAEETVQSVKAQLAEKWVELRPAWILQTLLRHLPSVFLMLQGQAV